MPSRSGATCPRRPDVASAVASAVGHFGRLDIMFNNVGIPTPRLGMAFEDHTVEDFERLSAVNFRGVFLGCKHAVIQFKKQGDGGVILNTGSVAGLVGWGGTVYGATKGAVNQLTRALAIEVAPFGHQGERHLPGRHAFHQLHGRRRHGALGRGARAGGGAHRVHAPPGPADHRRGLRGGRGVPVLRPRRPTSPASCSRSTAGTSPSDRDRRSSSTPSGSACSSTWRATSTSSSGGPTVETRTRCGASCGRGRPSTPERSTS